MELAWWVWGPGLLILFLQVWVWAYLHGWTLLVSPRPLLSDRERFHLFCPLIVSHTSSALVSLVGVLVGVRLFEITFVLGTYEL